MVAIDLDPKSSDEKPQGMWYLDFFYHHAMAPGTCLSVRLPENDHQWQEEQGVLATAAMLPPTTREPWSQHHGCHDCLGLLKETGENLQHTSSRH